MLGTLPQLCVMYFENKVTPSLYLNYVTNF